jgi:hypothetical protein
VRGASAEVALLIRMVAAIVVHQAVCKTPMIATIAIMKGTTIRGADSPRRDVRIAAVKAPTREAVRDRFLGISVKTAACSFGH